ncbi:MAG TPA: STAS domain-containing protein [Candidatus Dormibacteraeota bacterium]|nr:STAS domain-containing protein [Candidatus Dormibacteraeota bacterium]
MSTFDYGLAYLRGEFDLADQDRLDAALTTIAGARTAILDLRYMTYMDSTVLRCFTRFHSDRARTSDAAPRLLFEPTQAIARILHITGLDTIFPPAQPDELLDRPVGPPAGLDAESASSAIAIYREEGPEGGRWVFF